MNKYEKTPEAIIDLHGHTRDTAGGVIKDLVRDKKYGHVRIITGRAAFREGGPVLRLFVKDYLEKHRIKFAQSKLEDGGEGAFEVFLK